MVSDLEALPFERGVTSECAVYARAGCVNSQAFSLVELLVVVGVVAMIIALLMPALESARTQARAFRCLSNIRQLGIALRIYANDNKDNYPNNVSSPTPLYWNYAAAMGHYVAIPSTAMNASSVYWCPADDDAQQSYAMNVWASSAVDKSVSSLTTGTLWPHHRAAASMLLLAESWSYQSGTGNGWLPAPIIGRYGTSAGQRFGGLAGVGPIAAGRWGPVNCELTYARHRRVRVQGSGTQPRGRVSIFFDDGHAALCSEDDLVNPATG
jgi:type II secretory pathway pseudopilin PulG